MQPWKLLADPTGYIFRWLVAYSALLGAIGGILITDYYLLRRTRLDLKALYQGVGNTGTRLDLTRWRWSLWRRASRLASRVFLARSAP